MVRVLYLVLATLAAAAAIGFIALYLGGYPAGFAHERVALVPLIGGLGAGVLYGHRGGSVSGRAMVVSMVLLAAWVLSLCSSP